MLRPWSPGNGKPQQCRAGDCLQTEDKGGKISYWYSLLKIFSKELLTSVYIPCTQDFASEIVMENLPVRISEDEKMLQISGLKDTFEILS